MKRFQIMELFKEHHPNFTNVQFNLMLEQAANEIIEATGISKVTYKIDSVAGQRWYPLAAGIERVEKVYFNDVLIPKLIGEPKIDDDEFTSTSADSSDTALPTPTANSDNKRFWMISNWDLEDSTDGSEKKPRLGIVEKVNNAVTRDGRTSHYQSCSITGTSNIRVFAIAGATPSTVSGVIGVSDSGHTSLAGPLSSVPEKFHDVLLNGVVSLGYKSPRNLNLDLATFYESEFKKGIQRVKKHARTKNSTGFIKPQDF